MLRKLNETGLGKCLMCAKRLVNVSCYYIVTAINTICPELSSLSFTDSEIYSYYGVIQFRGNCFTLAKLTRGHETNSLFRTGNSFPMLHNIFAIQGMSFSRATYLRCCWVYVEGRGWGSRGEDISRL